MSRLAQLVPRALRPAREDVDFILEEAKTLASVGMFRSAFRLYREVPVAERPVDHILHSVQAGLSSMFGAQAEAELQHLLGTRTTEATGKELARTATLVNATSLPRRDRLRFLLALQDNAKRRRTATDDRRVGARRRAAIEAALLSLRLDKRGPSYLLEVATHVEGRLGWRRHFRLHLAVQLVKHGYQREALALVQDDLEQAAESWAIFKALVGHFPREVVHFDLTDPATYPPYAGSTAFLRHAAKAAADQAVDCEPLIASQTAILLAQLPDMDPAAVEEFVSTLMSLDEWDLVQSVAEQRGDLDWLPSLRLLQARRAFSEARYVDAAKGYRAILEEHPGNGYATTGYRHAMARLKVPGEFEWSERAVRQELGYGRASAGRPGYDESRGAGGVLGLMDGRYEDVMLRRSAGTFDAALAKTIRSRFRGHQSIDADLAARPSVFLVATQGVGDEIRSYQYFAALTEAASRVVASCDPRLQRLLEESFPEATFIPAYKLQKGNNLLRSEFNDRLRGVAPTVASLLTEDTRGELQSADLVLTDQTLMLNGHQGHLASSPGGHLSPSVDRRSQRSTPAPALPQIGLVWRSHKVSTWRMEGHLTLGEVETLVSSLEAEFVSLQHSMTPEEHKFCQRLHIEVPDVDLFDDLYGLAVVAGGLDAVMGVSTVPWEMAAAVGTPCLLVPTGPEPYFLRTGGGRHSRDCLTENARLPLLPQSVFHRPRDRYMGQVLEGVIAAARASRWYVAPRRPSGGTR